MRRGGEYEERERRGAKGGEQKNGKRQYPEKLRLRELGRTFFEGGLEWTSEGTIRRLVERKGRE